MSSIKKYFSKHVECGTIGVTVQETGHDYDFIASIINETDKTLKIFFDDVEGWCPEPLEIEPDEWTGILADDNGLYTLSFIKNGDFRVELETVTA